MGILTTVSFLAKKMSVLIFTRTSIVIFLIAVSFKTSICCSNNVSSKILYAFVLMSLSIASVNACINASISLKTEWSVGGICGQPWLHFTFRFRSSRLARYAHMNMASDFDIGCGNNFDSDLVVFRSFCPLRPKFRFLDGGIFSLPNFICADESFTGNTARS